ncbi:hypothetical protein GCM10028798_10290 [Humibacter antri]
MVPCLTLLRTRFAEPAGSPRPLVVSYTAVSPLPCACAKAVCFLWHCLAGHPGWALPTVLLCGARTFLGGTRHTDADATVLPARSHSRVADGGHPYERARPSS